MKTVVELSRDGTRTVFHRSGSEAWTHPEGDPYRMGFGVKQPCTGCPKAAGHSVVDDRESSSTGEEDDNALTSNVTKSATDADQALWDRSSEDGRKRYERDRKARKRAAYRTRKAATP